MRKPTRRQHNEALAKISAAEIALLKPMLPAGGTPLHSIDMRVAYNASDYATQSACDKLRDAWLSVVRIGFRG